MRQWNGRGLWLAEGSTETATRRKAGTFTPSWPVRLLAKGPARGYAHGYDLTLIAAEVLDELVLPSGGQH